MLKVIVMAIINRVFAFILVGEKKLPVFITACKRFLTIVFMKCMELILKLSPIVCSACFVQCCSKTVQPFIVPLRWYFLQPMYGYIVHAVVVYSFALKQSVESALTFFKEMASGIRFAFSSASSVGITSLLHGLYRELGSSREISSFYLHLVQQSTWSKCHLSGCVGDFYASCSESNLTLPQMLTIIFTANLASIGLCRRSGRMVMLAMYLLPLDFLLRNS